MGRQPSRSRKKWLEEWVTSPLTNVRLYAAVENGGIIVETRDLVFREGRVAMTLAEPEGEVPILQFVASFVEPDAAVPDTAVLVAARLVILATHTKGLLEIRGNGWVGYDERGCLEGSFDAPPQMLIEASDIAARQDGPAELTDEEFQTYLRTVHPQPPEQYGRAIRGTRVAAASDEALPPPL
jgi:hypothetical protein